MGERQNAVISILKNIVKPGMQGGFPAHEIDDRRVFDFGQKFVEEIFIFHGFSRGIYRFFHVLIRKTVIAA